jgi:hypothetical protein
LLKSIRPDRRQRHRKWMFSPAWSTDAISDELSGAICPRTPVMVVTFSMGGCARRALQVARDRGSMRETVRRSTRTREGAVERRWVTGRSAQSRLKTVRAASTAGEPARGQTLSKKAVEGGARRHACNVVSFRPAAAHPTRGAEAAAPHRQRQPQRQPRQTNRRAINAGSLSPRSTFIQTFQPTVPTTVVREARSSGAQLNASAEGSSIRRRIEPPGMPRATCRPRTGHRAPEDISRHDCHFAGGGSEKRSGQRAMVIAMALRNFTGTPLASRAYHSLAAERTS